MIQALVVERTILMLDAKAQLSSGCLVFFLNGHTYIGYMFDSQNSELLGNPINESKVIIIL